MILGLSTKGLIDKKQLSRIHEFGGYLESSGNTLNFAVLYDDYTTAL